jgi:hypothetical protein
MRDTPITVRELIKLLQEIDGDTVVHTEGCDCVGPCDGVRVGAQQDGTCIAVLTRDDTLVGGDSH